MPWVVCDKRGDINRVPVAVDRLAQWRTSADILGRGRRRRALPSVEGFRGAEGDGWWKSAWRRPGIAAAC